MKTSESKTVNIAKLVGKGYGDFWRCKKRYRVVKGSRGAKKSKTIGIDGIFRIMKYPEANMLCVRKTYRSLKDSCFTELKWAIHQLGVDSFFKCKENPLEITYLPTGQKIYFRGLDDPLKTTSITVEHGYLCFLWIEEAYEIMKEEDFDMLDESIRGAVPDYLFKQCTLSLNPWNEKHWIKKRFFDKKDKDVFTKTVDYRCNEFLDSADIELFERMKRDNPRRYQVAGLGHWGIVEGLVYENWEEKEFDIENIRRLPNIKSVFGLDFGYVNDPSALFCGLIDTTDKILYVFDEMYKNGLSNEMIYDEIYKMGYAKETIVADSAEKKSIDRLYTLGLKRIKGARKGPDSVIHGIDTLQEYKIIIHPRCVNFITEISNYQWAEDKTGKKLNKPIDDFNHLMDAMRYAVEDITKGKRFGF
ncbi:PBSX family phage terminase large subunit [Anaerofustis stercorihominis]|uniref:PBSX family phage terminase large subunit n=1 Tax=Anaerofustis stercorihominis TaxID=214853 RepID=UPI0039951138